MKHLVLPAAAAWFDGTKIDFVEMSLRPTHTKAGEETAAPAKAVSERLKS